jgi:hypothetical protein
VVGRAVRAVRGAPNADHHRFDAGAVVGAANDLALFFVGQGGFGGGLALQSDVIGDGFGIAGREGRKQLGALLPAKLPADDAVAIAGAGEG